MDKFEAMQRFLLVSRTRSFTRSAEVLGLPKSSVSHAIKQLEKDLGVRLFHRSTRSIALTQDGEAYLPKCRAILDELEAVESEFQHQSREVHGTIRVDMPSRFLCNLVLPHLIEWLEAYPNTQLQFSSTDYRIDPIKEGIDCVVRIGDLRDSSLIARPLTTFRVVNCASPAYLEKFGEPRSPDELQSHRLIGYSPDLVNSPTPFEYVEAGQVEELPMPNIVSVNSTDAYFSACLAGLGIAQIPLAGVSDYLKQGLLKTVLPTFEAEPMPVSMLYPSRRQLPPRLSLFMAWLEALADRMETE